MLSQSSVDSESSDQENISAKNIKSGAKCKNNDEHTGENMFIGRAQQICDYDEKDTFTRHDAECEKDVKHTGEDSSYDMTDEKGVRLVKPCRKRKNPDWINLENPLKKKQKFMKEEEKSETVGKSLKEAEEEQREIVGKSLKEPEEALPMSTEY